MECGHTVKKFLKITLFCGIWAVLCSCAHKQSLKKGPTPLPKATKPSPPALSLQKQLEKSMQALHQKAAAEGPHAVQFLATDLFLKANDLSIRGDAKAAAFLFRQIMLMLPSDEYIKKRYAMELVRTGELEKAKSHVRKLFEKTFKAQKPGNKKLGLILAGIYTSQGESKAAGKVYRKLLGREPGNAGFCIPLANLYRDQKDYQKAKTQLDRCEKQSQKKDRFLYHYHRGKLSMLQDKTKDALKEFSRALKDRPDYLPAAIIKGGLLEKIQRPKLAATVYEQFLKHVPNNRLVLAHLIRVVQNHFPLEEAIPHLEKLANLESDNLNLKWQLGMLYSKYKRWEEAKQTFREILLVAPESNRVLYSLGTLHQQSGEYEKAANYFSRVAEDSPLFSDSAIQTARALQRVGLRAPASLAPGQSSERRITDFVRQTSARHPQLAPELFVALANFHEFRGEVEKAIQILLELERQNTLEEDYQYYLATLYEKQNNYWASRQLMEKILAANPHHPHALNFLGYSLLETGDDLERGRSLVLKALSLEPNDGHIRDSLGWYYYKIGDYQKALKEIRQAYQLAPNDPIITKHLAMAYQKLNQYDKAKRHFEEALEYCRHQSERDQILQALAELPASKRSSP